LDKIVLTAEGEELKNKVFIIHKGDPKPTPKPENPKSIMDIEKRAESQIKL
jgi:hypothetical protein